MVGKTYITECHNVREWGISELEGMGDDFDGL